MENKNKTKVKDLVDIALSGMPMTIIYKGETLMYVSSLYLGSECTLPRTVLERKVNIFYLDADNNGIVVEV